MLTPYAYADDATSLQRPCNVLATLFPCDYLINENVCVFLQESFRSSVSSGLRHDKEDLRTRLKTLQIERQVLEVRASISYSISF